MSIQENTTIFHRYNYTGPPFMIASLSLNYIEILLNVESTLSFLINFVLITLLSANRKLRQCHSNVYLASLFLTYLCIALSNFSIHVLRALKSADLVLISLYSLQTCCIAASLNLILVTVDRFIAVRYPFLYDREKPLHARLLVVFVVWVPSILFLVMTSFFKPIPDSYECEVMLPIVIALVTLLMANVYNFVTARKLIAKEITSTNSTSVATTMTNRRRNKGTYVCLAIVFVFTTNWLPECIVLFLSATHQIDFMQKLNLMQWTLPLVAANGVFGPLVYVLFTRDVRRELQRSFARCCCFETNTAADAY